MLRLFFFLHFSPINRISLSQPDPTIEHIDRENDQTDSDDTRIDEPNNVFFSQPTNINDMLLSQIATTPGSSQVNLLFLYTMDFRNVLVRSLQKWNVDSKMEFDFSIKQNK